MEVTCISVQNPYSYQLCAGIKDVENRSWNTKFRGRLYIHSCGDSLPYVPEEEWPKNIDKTPYGALVDKFAKLQCEFYEKKGINLDEGLPENPNAWFCQTSAIIGYVDIVDVVRGFKSPFAIRDQYHWIVKNSVLFEKPIAGVKGKLSLWRYDL